MKLVRIVGIIVCVISIESCHLFSPDEDYTEVSIYFNESNVTIYKGGLGSFSLRIDPPNGLDYYTVDYTVTNEDIAVIYRADRRGVVVSGKNIGSTVITAKIGNAEAKAVVNVIDD